MKRPTPGLLFFALVAALVSGPLLAHGIGLWAEVKGDHVEVEAHYTDGAPVANGKVTVSADGKTLLTGTTDGSGKWTFVPPVRKALKIRLLAGGHHAATARIKESDLKDVPIAPRK